jgi:hypothetical protein
METSRLEIGYVAAEYLVSAEHPSPQRVKDRLDAVIARELPRTLARAFDSWFSDGDPSIWIIQQLNIEAAINVASEPEHITRALTAQLARSLGAAFQDGNQTNVRHFPSRAAYLASFLSDLTFGTAWSQWYYESFTGLNPLPLSAALRTAICDEIATGKMALSLLATAELQRVVHSLTLQDARQVLQRLAEERSAGEEFRCREAVVRAIPKNAVALAKLGDEWRRALYLFIAVSREDKELGGAPLRNAALSTVRLGDQLSKSSVDESHPLGVASTSGELSSLYLAAGSDAQVPLDPRSTALGGIFLILPHLDELPLVEAVRDWPHVDEAAAISLVRFLVLLKCCGGEGSESAFYDPLLRDLLLIPPTLFPEGLRTWQSQLKREHFENFLATLLKWQRSRGAIGGKEQLLTVSRFRGLSLMVLVDATRGLWLLVDGYLPHQPQKIIEALRPPVAMLMEEEGVLYSDPSLISPLQANFAALNVINVSDHVTELAEAGMRGIDAVLARLDKLPDELEFLTLSASFKITRPLDLVLSIVAQHLLRGIAWRLPGFAQSNLAYLSRNFLDFSASIEEEPARRVVRVDRPPLHLVLNMTGMMRQSYRLSWLDERPFALFQGD